MMPRKGERLKILGTTDPWPWYRPGDMATVEYVLPDYGKIIVSVVGRTGACLYDAEEGVTWERLHPKDKTDDTD